MDAKLKNLLKSMENNEVKNYVIPGLSSFLLGSRHSKGSVRLFRNSRLHFEKILPHSHRHDFSCLVLQGHVKNTVWTEHSLYGELYNKTIVTNQVNFPGNYTIDRSENNFKHMQFETTTYNKGEWYHAVSTDIHSIEFSKDAVVLFLSGPDVNSRTVVLEPVVDGKIIPTFKIEDWMFEHDFKETLQGS